MECKDKGLKKGISRSLLIKASEVLELLNTDNNDPETMGKMRQRAFEILPREDMLKVREYFNSPSDFTVNEDT
jgi:hypothetical protein